MRNVPKSKFLLKWCATTYARTMRYSKLKVVCPTWQKMFANIPARLHRFTRNTTCRWWGWGWMTKLSQRVQEANAVPLPIVWGLYRATVPARRSQDQLLLTTPSPWQPCEHNHIIASSTTNVVCQGTKNQNIL